MNRTALVVAAMLALATQTGCIEALLFAAMPDDPPPTRAERDKCARFLEEHADDLPEQEMFDPRASLYMERSHCEDAVQRYDAWQQEVRAAAREDTPRPSRSARPPVTPAW